MHRRIFSVSTPAPSCQTFPKESGERKSCPANEIPMMTKLNGGSTTRHQTDILKRPFGFDENSHWWGANPIRRPLQSPLNRCTRPQTGLPDVLIA
ncbi:MAG: hypothetical protein CMJ80_01245 [Planctomycetaceae bacterium]|nr:hypothetical protein [Planctomycetaceae bacterium]